jgi:hypothetical protein
VSYILFGFALIAGGLVAPAMFQDRIVVTPEEIATTTGFWFEPTREGFVYRHISHVRITTARDLKGRIHPAWDIHYSDGRVHQIPLSDLWKLNSARIVDLLRGYGVTFAK